MRERSKNGNKLQHNCIWQISATKFKEKEEKVLAGKKVVESNFNVD